jgi:alpha-tubulin suppressor-like RCC1 family protein
VLSGVGIGSLGVGAGGQHVLAISTDGNLYSWGLNDCGRKFAIDLLFNC